MAFKDTKPYYFGMELELNKFVRKDAIRNICASSIIGGYGSENPTISEYRMNPCHGLEFIRQAAFIGHNVGFEYAAGHYDDRAESFHLHIGRRQSRISCTENLRRLLMGSVGHANILLMAASHLSRNGQQWRSNVSSGARAMYCDHVTYDSKDYWITNNNVGTLEVRLNENPSPLVPMLLLPVVAEGSISHDTNYTGYVFCRHTPKDVEDTIKSEMGVKTVHKVVSESKKYWYYHPLIVSILNMYLEGATHIEIHEKVHANLSRNSLRYNNLLKGEV